MGIFQFLRNHFAGRVAALMLSTFFSAAISIGLLPFTTRMLGPADYGSYSLLMSIVALIGFAMDGGASLLLPSSLGPASSQERGQIFVAASSLATIGSTAFAVLLVSAGYYFQDQFDDHVISFMSFALAAAIIPMRSITSIAVIAFSTTGRGYAIALQMAVQASVVFATTLIALFVLSMEGISLFIGAACGQLAALTVCLATLISYGEFSIKPSLHWHAKALRSAVTSSLGGFSDGARSFGENATLGRIDGLHAVGIVNHARLYYSLLAMVMSAVGHNVQARSLADARIPHSKMAATRRAWVPVHLFIICASAFFALFAREIVDFISNGKFVDAAPYIPILCLVALMQSAEQPAAAIVYSIGQAAKAVRFRILTNVVALIALVPVVHCFGIAGVVILCWAEAATNRYYLRFLASRYRDVPFQDSGVYFGFLLIVGTMLWVYEASPSVTARAWWLGGTVIVTGIFGWRSIADIVAEGRRVLTQA